MLPLKGGAWAVLATIVRNRWWKLSKLLDLSPRDPGDPPHIYIYNKKKKFYIYTDVSHTHPAFGRVVRREMRWRWGWGGSEGEMTMKMRWKLLNQDAKRGTQKKKERTPTRHTWPGAGKPWKGKGKEKRRVDGHGTRPAEGGEGRKRLNQPDTARTYTHLSTRRSRPTWGGKNAWDRGPMGISWWKHKN